MITVHTALDIVSWICLVGGSFFCVVGGIGLHRLPDFYARGHAAGVTDTLGAGLIFLGLMFQTGGVDLPALAEGFGHFLSTRELGALHEVEAALDLNLFRLSAVLAFLVVTSPTSSHALAKAAFTRGLVPKLAPVQGNGEDE